METKKCIALRGQTIEYAFKPSRRSRNIRLTVHGDGRFVVSAPRRASEQTIDGFIRQKAEWILEKLAYAKLHPLSPKRTRKDFLENKTTALIYVKRRVAELNSAYGFRFGKISIRNQKTRWGSCSRSGNLSFNYRILFLAPHLADYLVVHELCHLRELNHSKKFWALVAQTIPSFKAARKELRKTGSVS